MHLNFIGTQCTAHGSTQWQRNCHNNNHKYISSASVKYQDFTNIPSKYVPQPVLPDKTRRDTLNKPSIRSNILVLQESTTVTMV